MTTPYEPDAVLLISKLRRDYMPEWKLDFVDKLIDYFKVKMWRLVYPTILVILKMVAVAQNTAEWMGYRDGSFGGSGYAAIAGYDEWADNVSQWRLETGLDMYRPSKNREKHRPAQHGHEFEDEAGHIHAVLMGTRNRESGINLHWKFPHMHVSPDLLVDYYLHNMHLHNIYAANDKQHGLGEIKQFQVRKYETPSGRMTMPVGYYLQCINQMDITCTDWNDWIKNWRCRNLEDKETARPVPLGNRRFLVCQTSIMRVYANVEAAKILAIALLKHMQALRTKKEPARRFAFGPNAAQKSPPIKFPNAVLLPLKRCRFIMTLPEGETNPIDPDGMLNRRGTIEREIEHFLHQKPLSITTEALHSGSDECVELDAVPAPPVYPKLDEVNHPLIRALMEQDPSTPIYDHIRAIATLDRKILEQFAPELLPEARAAAAVAAQADEELRAAELLATTDTALADAINASDDAESHMRKKRKLESEDQPGAAHDVFTSDDAPVDEHTSKRIKA